MQSKKIPRPANSFFIYRSYINQLCNIVGPAVLGDKERRQGDLSKVVSSMWKSECPETVARFKRRAELKKLQHQAEHPEYKYCPRTRLAKLKGEMESTMAETYGAPATDSSISSISHSSAESNPESTNEELAGDLQERSTEVFAVFEGDVSNFQSHLDGVPQQLVDDAAFSQMYGLANFSETQEDFHNIYDYSSCQAEVQSASHVPLQQQPSWEDSMFWLNHQLTGDAAHHHIGRGWDTNGHTWAVEDETDLLQQLQREFLELPVYITM